MYLDFSFTATYIWDYVQRQIICISTDHTGNIFHMFTFTNIATVRNFKALPDKFAIVIIYSIGNYGEKQITEL
jgi:hypothetical protein